MNVTDFEEGGVSSKLEKIWTQLRRGVINTIQNFVRKDWRNT